MLAFLILGINGCLLNIQAPPGENWFWKGILEYVKYNLGQIDYYAEMLKDEYPDACDKLTCDLNLENIGFYKMILVQS